MTNSPLINRLFIIGSLLCTFALLPRTTLAQTCIGTSGTFTARTYVCDLQAADPCAESTTTTGPYACQAPAVWGGACGYCKDLGQTCTPVYDAGIPTGCDIRGAGGGTPCGGGGEVFSQAGCSWTSPPVATNTPRPPTPTTPPGQPTNTPAPPPPPGGNCGATCSTDSQCASPLICAPAGVCYSESSCGPPSCNLAAPTSLKYSWQGLGQTGVDLEWYNSANTDKRQLRVDPSQTKVESGCGSGPSSCTVKNTNNSAPEGPEPDGREARTILSADLSAGKKYYWRIVDYNTTISNCFKGVTKDFISRCEVQATNTTIDKSPPTTIFDPKIKVDSTNYLGRIYYELTNNGPAANPKVKFMSPTKCKNSTSSCDVTPADYDANDPAFPEVELKGQNTGNNAALKIQAYYKNYNPGAIACEGNIQIDVKNISCNITLPATLNLNIGDPAYSQAVTIASEVGSISQIRFSVTNQTIASATTPDNTRADGFITDIAPLNVGTTTLTAAAYINGNQTCTAPMTVIVGNPPVNDNWWQVVGGVVHSNAAGYSTLDNAIRSQIPAAAAPKYLITDSDGYHGLLSYASGTASFGSNGGSVAAAPAYQARSAFTGPRFDYASLQSLLPTATPISTPSLIWGDLNLSTPGTAIFSREGDLAIDQAQTITANKKLVILVSGDLTIKSKINLAAENATQSIIFVVGGNILIDPALGGGSAVNPDLEGVYIATGTIHTGTAGTDADNQLVVKGNMIGYGQNGTSQGVALERDLPPAIENTTPGELFIQRPDLLISVPSALSRKTTLWSEVAP